jgi:hypothetical protein
MDAAIARHPHPATCQALAPAQGWLPPFPARSAVLGTLVRPSPGRHGVPQACALTHLPALPAVLLIWVQGGAARPPGALAWGAQGLPAGLYLSAPRERPQTLVHAPDAALTLLLLRPDAWRARMRTDWSSVKDRLLPEHEWCQGAGAAAWPAALGAQASLPTHDLAQAMQAFLQEVPHAAPTERAHDRGGPRSWWPALDARLAQHPVGDRQRERLSRTWTGLTPRMLRAQARAEAALLHAAALRRRGQLDWRQVALLAGYTDQPHLCRETRRHTGFSPVQLMHGMLGEEAFWVYRAWTLARLERMGPMA